MDEKFKNEVFTVLRTMQDLMITDLANETMAKHFALPGHAGNPPLTMNDLFKTHEIIEKEFYREEYSSNNDFKDLLDFFKNKLITETYDWNELESFVEQIQDDHILDSDLYVDHKVIQKR